MRNKLSFSPFIDKYDRKQKKDSFKFANHSKNAQKTLKNHQKTTKKLNKFDLFVFYDFLGTICNEFIQTHQPNAP